jgi:hypothetical protein
MGSLEVIFGAVVVVLAALAVIGALVFAVVWEVCAIRRTLADYRDPATRPPTMPTSGGSSEPSTSRHGRPWPPVTFRPAVGRLATTSAGWPPTWPGRARGLGRGPTGRAGRP